MTDNETGGQYQDVRLLPCKRQSAAQYLYVHDYKVLLGRANHLAIAPTFRHRAGLREWSPLVPCTTCSRCTSEVTQGSAITEARGEYLGTGAAGMVSEDCLPHSFIARARACSQADGRDLKVVWSVKMETTSRGRLTVTTQSIAAAPCHHHVVMFGRARALTPKL